MSVSGRPRCVRKLSSRDCSRRTVPPAARASAAAISSNVSGSTRWPKPPPTKGLIDADLRAVDAEAVGQRQVQVVRHLRHRLRRQALALGLPARRAPRSARSARARPRRSGRPARAPGRPRRSPPRRRRTPGRPRARCCPACSACSSTAPSARAVGGVEVRRQRLDVEHDRRQRRLGARLVDRGHRGDRLAAVAHALARQRPFVLRDRDHAVRRGEVGAGDHRAHAGQRARLRGVDRADHAVRDRAAQDASDQRLAGRQVGGVARAAGDLFDAVDQRRAPADARLAQRLRGIGLTSVSIASGLERRGRRTAPTR